MYSYLSEFISLFSYMYHHPILTLSICIENSTPSIFFRIQNHFPYSILIDFAHVKMKLFFFFSCALRTNFRIFFFFSLNFQETEKKGDKREKKRNKMQKKKWEKKFLSCVYEENI